MSPDEEAKQINRILVISSRNLADARDAFCESFGFKVTSKDIDREIAKLFREAADEAQPIIAIPTRIGLALYLREGGSGRRRGDRRKPVRSRRTLRSAVKEARRRKVELEAKGTAPGKAERNAAEEAEKSLREREVRYDPPSWQRIKRLMQSDKK